ncbi:MAG: CFI-box-CTERM domain-containing protein, partial [Candidatus Bathyarchaeia archaeon]
VDEAAIDTYLHYEKNTKLMIYGELNAQSTLFSYRYTFKLKEANLPFTSGTPGGLPRSECLIATAAFGSRLAPEVQSLRGFRDNIVLSTSSGSEFMKVFNAWYYSFSPTVADVLRGSEAERWAARALIYPLIGVLKAATLLYSVFSFNKEGAVILSGLAASSLIGLIYFTPPTTVILYALRVLRPNLRPGAVRHIFAFQAWSLGFTCLGVIARSPLLLMISTPALVLSTIAAVSGYASLRILSRK